MKPLRVTLTKRNLRIPIFHFKKIKNAKKREKGNHVKNNGLGQSLLG